MKKQLEFSTIYCGDLHGRIWAFEEAVETFEREKLDKLVFIGDYVDSKEICNVEMKYLLEQVIKYKREHMESVILLLGNHDYQYANFPDYRCSGFRVELQSDLYKLFNDNRDIFQIAWRNGDYMATHAGILSEWTFKYNDRLSYYADKFNIDRVNNLDILLNAINETSDKWILATTPVIRGGVAGSIGGPIWADISNITSKEGNGCLYKYTHIVGHSRVDKITEHQRKGGPVTIFIDCLGGSGEFLILKK